MRMIKEILAETYLIELKDFKDHRGHFVKTYAESVYEGMIGSVKFVEEFYSISNRDVIRGMHFQKPPHEHLKIVYCPVGSILDVMLDLRPGHDYGKFCSVLLDANLPQVLIIPSGVAHGFRSLEDNSVTIYKTTSEYSMDFDSGIRWDSFGFDWKIEAPSLSDRDKNLIDFNIFYSPF